MYRNQSQASAHVRDAHCLYFNHSLSAFPQKQWRRAFRSDFSLHSRLRQSNLLSTAQNQSEQVAFCHIWPDLQKANITTCIQLCSITHCSKQIATCMYQGSYISVQPPCMYCLIEKSEVCWLNMNQTVVQSCTIFSKDCKNLISIKCAMFGLVSVKAGPRHY